MHHRQRGSIDCSPFGRRDLLQRCGTGLGAMALAERLAEAGLRAEVAPSGAVANVTKTAAVGPAPGTDALAARRPPLRAKAKRVIHIFPNGGASHVDSFDPKPALEKYAGKPIPTGTPKTE